MYHPGTVKFDDNPVTDTKLIQKWLISENSHTETKTEKVFNTDTI